MMELKKGITLKNGKYTIQKKIGNGSFGITYVATMRVQVGGSLGSIESTVTVAIKEFFMSELNTRSADGSLVEGSQNTLVTNYRRKFRTEAQNLGQCKHSNIVKVLEVWDENNTTYYAMEHIDGISLDDYIHQHGPMPEPKAIKMFSQLADAVQYMHSKRMLHLDIKPKNAMVRKDGSLVLIDFGLSKQYDTNGDPESSTRVGGGTPGYAPVEQADFHDGKGFPVTMDVYALGGTLYKMLTAQTPPVASAIVCDGFPTAKLQTQRISPLIISAIEKAMSPSKHNRYQSVAEIQKALSIKEEQTQMGSEPLYAEVDKQEATKQERQNGKVLNFEVQGERFKMVFVEGGSFIMGDEKEFDNHPHLVTLSDYYIGETVVTQALWKAVMGWMPIETKTNRHFFREEKTQDCFCKEDERQVQSFPACGVSFEDVVDFIERLISITGYTFRLPTEAEWEYAARGGCMSHGYKYSGSNKKDDVAWYRNNSDLCVHPVGQKQSNELGLFDMSGNVAEWCEDWYDPIDDNDHIENPHGPDEDDSTTLKVIRGGSYCDTYDKAIVFRRDCSFPTKRVFSNGFRLALSSLLPLQENEETLFV